MPPVPRPVTLPPAKAKCDSSILRTSGINWAAGSLRGSAVKRPGWSVRSSSRSALTSVATRAERLLPSLTRISLSHSVVFVDDRDDALFEQGGRHRSVEEALAIFHVGGEQDLAYAHIIDCEKAFHKRISCSCPTAAKSCLLTMVGGSCGKLMGTASSL